MSKASKAIDATFEDIEVRRYTANILAVYARTDHVLRAAGAAWYGAAHKDCAALARKYGLTVEQVAGAAAAISPGMRWDLVLGYVERLIGRKGSTGKLGFAVPTYSKLFVDRARSCLRGKLAPSDVLGGNKVRAFYALLCDSGNGYDVCVDGHAFNIAINAGRAPIRGENSKVPSLTDKRYRMLSDAYRAAAQSVGILPHQMQAITWVQHRRPDQHSGDLPF